MASAASEIIRATGQGFNEERKILNSDDTTAYLLVREGQSNDNFKILEQVLTNWKNRFSEFRVQMNLQIADEDPLIVTAIKKCSDMSIDGYVYEIDQRDKMPPDGDRPWWDLFGIKTGEIFVPPIETNYVIDGSDVVMEGSDHVIWGH